MVKTLTSYFNENRSFEEKKEEWTIQCSSLVEHLLTKQTKKPKTNSALTQSKTILLMQKVRIHHSLAWMFGIVFKDGFTWVTVLNKVADALKNLPWIFTVLFVKKTKKQTNLNDKKKE